jgi:hypothetical protein
LARVRRKQFYTLSPSGYRKLATSKKNTSCRNLIRSNTVRKSLPALGLKKIIARGQNGTKKTRVITWNTKSG